MKNSANPKPPKALSPAAKRWWREIVDEYGISDPGFFMLGGHRFNDDKKGGHGFIDMYRSIAMSCDVYYYQLGNDMGIDRISSFMKPFGFGEKTGIDLEHEKTGILPSQEWKRERFKRNRAAQKWVGGDTISIAIGNGFNSYTPLQMAHAVANLANDGVSFATPSSAVPQDAVQKATDFENQMKAGTLTPPESIPS